MWSLGMILHKLLFFKLPYRYASEGNANGNITGEIGDGDKMDRLEAEVLSYPGFVSESTDSIEWNFHTFSTDSNQHRRW